MESLLISAVFGAMVGLLYSFWVQNKVNAKGGCPDCGTPVPRFRHPTSFRQALWGGWTCSECGTEMDRHGDEILEE